MRRLAYEASDKLRDAAGRRRCPEQGRRTAYSVFTSGAYTATPPNAAFPQEPGGNYTGRISREQDQRTCRSRSEDTRRCCPLHFVVRYDNIE